MKKTMFFIFIAALVTILAIVVSVAILAPSKPCDFGPCIVKK